jgi:hypothetical protein
MQAYFSTFLFSVNERLSGKRKNRPEHVFPGGSWLERADSQLSKYVPNVLVRQNGKNKIRINPNARYRTLPFFSTG